MRDTFKKAVKRTGMLSRWVELIAEVPGGWHVWVSDPYGGMARRKYLLSPEGRLVWLKEIETSNPEGAKP